MAREQAPIPMYPDENRIALEVMGPARAKEWPSKARYLEDKHGLPPVDELMGGRFWPAVVEYFKTRHGIALPPAVDGVSNSWMTSTRVRVVPFKPDGKESFDGPETQRPDGRRHRSRDHRSGV
ncbi:hypothetical protein AB7813_08930 [Tardiphaga sp. 20_F10_N6_6]|uniref:hypothetical protein n=1 Tax=Tardiphaga sp. 20_F10_N6_6 TaxID=3240788 RepID=UPI003F88E82E